MNEENQDANHEIERYRQKAFELLNEAEEIRQLSRDAAPDDLYTATGEIILFYECAIELMRRANDLHLRKSRQRREEEIRSEDASAKRGNQEFRQDD